MTIFISLLMLALPAMAAPKTPVRDLTIAGLMDVVESAKNYSDFIEKLTAQYPPRKVGSFFGQHNDLVITPETPQMILSWSNAMVAYSPKTYAEALFSVGRETVQFQFVERPDGQVSINAFTFKNSASPVPAPDHELTPSLVRSMPTAELVQKTSRYAEKVCIRCHLDIRRRLFEPENFGRRFEADPKWIFRTTAQREKTLGKLSNLFKTFADGDARTNPLYKWLWGDGKELKAADTFHHAAFAREAMTHNAAEMLDRLRQNPRWSENAAIFTAAVNGDAGLDKLLKAKGQTQTEITKARREAELFLAQINLKYAKKLNAENVAWILAGSKHDELAHFADNDYLLLNADSIRAIGPAIFELLVTDAQYAALEPDARWTHVRLRDLAVKDVRELVALVLTPEARRNAKRTTDTYLVLLEMLGNKNKAMAHFSGSLGVNAITVGQGLNILDLYAANLADCAFDLKSASAH